MNLTNNNKNNLKLNYMKTIHISEIGKGDKIILDLSSWKKPNLILEVESFDFAENCVRCKDNEGMEFYPDNNGMFIQP